MDDRFVQAAELLTELLKSINMVIDTLQSAVGIIRPSAVSEALSGVAQATESAALRVLDEAEALQEDQHRLSAALERLRSLLPPGHPEALAVWQDAEACSSTLSARAVKLIAAMEFQDLASQHIAHSVQAVDEVRTRLSSILALLGINPLEAAGPAPTELARLGGADQARGARQAIADEVFAARSSMS